MSRYSKRHPIVTLLATESKLVALKDAALEVDGLKNLIKKIPPFLPELVRLYCNYKDTILLITNANFSSKTKHISRNYCFIKEMIGFEQIILVHVDSKNMLANPLSKSVPKDMGKKLLKKMKISNTITGVVYECFASGGLLVSYSFESLKNYRSVIL